MSDLDNETFGGTWPFAPRFFEHDGVCLHYVDEGEGEPEQIASLIQDFLERNPRLQAQLKGKRW